MLNTRNTPLAELLRPTTPDDFIGQEHLTGKGAILRGTIEKGIVPSMIFWGPPGVGKTTLANIIAAQAGLQFFTLSAISSGVKDVRAVIERSKEVDGKAILFIDEIHRFSKSQQDSLLGAVEKGLFSLIGATTENPSFEVIPPLLSRCQVYILKTLSEDDLHTLINRAVTYYKNEYDITVDVKENEALIRISGGDARKLYNAIQLAVESSAEKGETVTITNKLVLSVVQENLAIYDKQGEMHYDIISAFIKSVRGSDPNAALYWLARMVEGGEDPKFIARRLIILAAEDIGLANLNALLIANACFDAVSKIGWPESRIILAETTIYLATSPKSNSAYIGINRAQSLVKKTGDLSIPLHLRNAPTELMKKMNYGKEYKYAHDFPGHFVEQDYLPEAIRGTILYHPCKNPQEDKNAGRLKKIWKYYYPY